MRFVHIERSGYHKSGGSQDVDKANSIANADKPSSSGTYDMRAFLVRRPVGTVSKACLDEEFAKCVLKSTTAHTLLDRGWSR